MQLLLYYIKLGIVTVCPPQDCLFTINFKFGWLKISSPSHVASSYLAFLLIFSSFPSSEFASTILAWPLYLCPGSHFSLHLWHKFFLPDSSWKMHPCAQGFWHLKHKFFFLSSSLWEVLTMPIFLVEVSCMFICNCETCRWSVWSQSYFNSII